MGTWSLSHRTTREVPSIRFLILKEISSREEPISLFLSLERSEKEKKKKQLSPHQGLHLLKTVLLAENLEFF